VGSYVVLPNSPLRERGGFAVELSFFSLPPGTERFFSFFRKLA